MNIIFPAWRTRTASTAFVSVGLERHIDTNIDAARLGVRHITFRISDADNWD
jgi:hypothetical protein